jgi:hypothetical protein
MTYLIVFAGWRRTMTVHSVTNHFISHPSVKLRDEGCDSIYKSSADRQLTEKVIPVQDVCVDFA